MARFVHPLPSTHIPRCDVIIVCFLRVPLLSADVAVVSVLTTRHTVYSGSVDKLAAVDSFTNTERRVKATATTPFHVRNTRAPPAVAFYCANMAGVDKSDRWLSEYSVLRSSRRWYMALFYRALDIAIVNSFILYKLATSAPVDNQFEFRCELVDQLLEAHRSATDGHTVSMDAVHMPVHRQHAAACRYCEPVSRGRADLKLARPTTRIACDACDMHLCLNATRNCFAEHHLHLKAAMNDDVCD